MIHTFVQIFKQKKKPLNLIKAAGLKHICIALIMYQFQLKAVIKVDFL